MQAAAHLGSWEASILLCSRRGRGPTCLVFLRSRRLSSHLLWPFRPDPATGQGCQRRWTGGDSGAEAGRFWPFLGSRRARYVWQVSVLPKAQGSQAPCSPRHVPLLLLWLRGQPVGPVPAERPEGRSLARLALGRVLCRSYQDTALRLGRFGSRCRHLLRVSFHPGHQSGPPVMPSRRSVAGRAGASPGATSPATAPEEPPGCVNARPLLLRSRLGLLKA